MLTISDRQIVSMLSRRGLGKSALTFAGAIVLAAVPAWSVHGDALSFDTAPVTNAVAQIDRAFGTNITIEQGVNEDRLVTFSIADVDRPGARLEAVDGLAHALDADYTKTFVIRRAADASQADAPVEDETGSSAVAAPVDSDDALVVFPDKIAPAEDAIRAVAAVDGASVKFYSPIHGAVTFSSAELTAADAASDIERQTNTVWKVEYKILPRRAGTQPREESALSVVGYTANGTPVTELPDNTALVYTAPPASTPQSADAQTPANAAAPATEANTAASTAPQAPAYPYGYYPYGAYPGYYPYGYGYPGYYPGYAPAAPMVFGGISGYGSNNPYGGYGYGYGSPYAASGYGYGGYGYGGGYGYAPAAGYGYAPYGGGYGYAAPWGGNTYMGNGVTSAGSGSTIVGGSPVTLPSYGLGPMY